MTNKKRANRQQEKLTSPKGKRKMDENSEMKGHEPQSIWGINRKDSMWFKGITAGVGTVLTIIIATATIVNTPESYPIEQALTEITIGMAAAFTASGFGTWTMLSAKDIIMSLADAIRQRTRKRTQTIREEGRAEGREQALKDLAAKAEAEGNTALLDLIRKTANDNTDSN